MAIEESNLKIVVAIVIYNKEINNSITLNNVSQIDSNIHVVVADNSTEDFHNAEACSKLGYTYITMDGNKGLSKAYNSVINAALDADIFVFMDDDTEVPLCYFEKLQTAANHNSSVDIFAPIMIGQNGVIYSPNNAAFMRNHFLASPNETPDQNSFNAIASCLAVRSRVFDDYRFNEKLFVDQIDQNFCDDMRAMNKKFMKLDVVIKQNFYQRGDNLTPEAGWSRLSLRIVDLMRYARLKGGPKYLLMGYAKCCGLGLQIAKKTNSPKVFAKALGLSTSCLLKPR